MLPPTKVHLTTVAYGVGNGYRGDLRINANKRPPPTVDIKGVILPYLTNGSTVEFHREEMTVLDRYQRVKKAFTGTTSDFFDAVLRKTQEQWKDFFASLQNLGALNRDEAHKFLRQYSAQLRESYRGTHFLHGDMTFDLQPEEWAPAYWLELARKRELKPYPGRQRRILPRRPPDEELGSLPIARKALENRED